MWWKRIATVSLVAGMFVSVVASGVGANEDDPIFGDGYYVLVIPGVAPFMFEVYVDDPDKEAWKDAAGLEVEMKLDKIESNVTWGTNGVATLRLAGGTITVTEPDADGDFLVTASGKLFAFGSGSDWIVADQEKIENIGAATQIFSVEATADGIEIKAVSEPGKGFLNDLNEEYEEEEEAEEVESEDDGSEGAGHGKDKNKGKGKNH